MRGKYLNLQKAVWELVQNYAHFCNSSRNYFPDNAITSKLHFASNSRTKSHEIYLLKEKGTDFLKFWFFYEGYEKKHLCESKSLTKLWFISSFVFIFLCILNLSTELGKGSARYEGKSVNLKCEVIKTKLNDEIPHKKC